ncbi:hypothetical protein LEMLEM_LOCUS1784, partial [Lemmus lemmus]
MKWHSDKNPSVLVTTNTSMSPENRASGETHTANQTVPAPQVETHTANHKQFQLLSSKCHCCSLQG